jgi:PelA/Pel-15E family pectate lyase
MRDFSRRVVFGFSVVLAGFAGSSLSSCSEAPSSAPGGMLPSFGAGDPSMLNPAGMDADPAAPTGTGANPAATGGAPGEFGETPAMPGGPLDTSGIAGAPSNPGDPTTSPEEPSAVPPEPLVDCSQAGSAPITVDWDAIGDQAPEWYATPEALSLAENILYYRNGEDGWPKGIDMTTRTAPRGGNSTIDNNTTTDQIDYLARVYSATFCPKYGDAARRGIEYLLEGQYDNGGWPQIFPNASGYSTHITYNDNAMVHVLELLDQVAKREDHYAFANATLAASSAAAVDRGIGCILATQVVIDGTKTAWCAQHDEVTLDPAQARTYELPSLSGSEGANLFAFLMRLDNPRPEVREAVNSAAAWFARVAISGIRIQSTVDASQTTGEDRVVVQDASAPLLWARFYELGTDRPIFSSRCEVAQCEDDPFFMRRYSLAEIENERRVGYAWYGNWPRQLLATTYPAWQARWGE